MSKHTPGLFKKETYVHDGDAGSEFVITVGPRVIAAEISNEADADLFATAPELLEALQALIKKAGVQQYRDLYLNALKAIEKAKGREG